MHRPSWRLFAGDVTIGSSKKIVKELIGMTVRERLLAIRLAEKLDRDPGYARRIGVRVEIREVKERDRRG